MGERDELLDSISATVADYRVGDLPQRTPTHVDRWIRQFPEDAQIPMLVEFSHVLQKTYISKVDMAGYIRDVVTTTDLVGNGPEEFWKHVAILNIQQRGHSQADILELLDNELRHQWGFGVSDCSGTNGTFVYLDDVLYSGMRIGDDLSHWIATQAPGEADVVVFLYASHTYGQWKCGSRLTEAAWDAGKAILVRFHATRSIENRLARRESPAVLWPVELPEDSSVEAFVDQPHKYGFTPRTPHGPLGPFSSEPGRQLLERELLITGARIRAAYTNPTPSMRPLGFSAFGLGFGSMIVTYRNCPNNAPLALWWDGLAIRRSGGWYPLFPRKTYGQGAVSYGPF